MKNLFVTGIGTDVGKTICSAVLVQAFGFDYWKPVQAGEPENTDSDRIKSLVKRRDFTIFPEGIKLKQPASPHIAAEHEKRQIRLDDLRVPKSRVPIIIEGAGGVMVPLNDTDTILDLISQCDARVVIVSRNYLGSINHSLLTFESLNRKGLIVAGWVFNGEPDKGSEDIIIKKTKRPFLFRINHEIIMSPDVIAQYATDISQQGVLFEQISGK